MPPAKLESFTEINCLELNARHLLIIKRLQFHSRDRIIEYFNSQINFFFWKALVSLTFFTVKYLGLHSVLIRIQLIIKVET